MEQLKKSFLLKNVGNADLEISDMVLTPDDGSFQVDFAVLTTSIEKLQTYDLHITFLASEERPYEAQLEITYNNAKTSPETLPGPGIFVRPQEFYCGSW